MAYEKSKNRSRAWLFALSALGTIAIVSAGISIGQRGPDDMSEAESLGSVEIREYEGQKLSSVNDFRENSIKGPQYVNKETYKLAVTGLVAEPKTYTYDQAIDGRTNYKKVVKLDCVEGWSAAILWEGFLVWDQQNQPHYTAGQRN